MPDKAYQLPGNRNEDLYLIPVSGGADSTALAILMHEMFPHVNFRLCFTDTGAEEPSIYETLKRLEIFLGKKIDWIAPERDLWQLIRDFNNFLPSSRDRYCTRELKLKSFSRWMKQFDGRRKWMFVGIRADEPFRLAFTTEDASTEMPLLDLGWKRADVFEKLRSTIGIPELYRTRLRSGCSVCPFQRRSELVGLLQSRPEEFAAGAAVEKLSEQDLARHESPPHLSQETGLTPNWLNLPMPGPTDTLEGKLGCRGQTLFDDIGVYAGAEFFTATYPGYPPFTWAARLVSFSSSLGGIKRQLDGRFQHLLATAEAQDMTEEEVRRDVRFAVYYLEAPSSTFDPQGPGDGSYTWKQGESYRQIKHVHDWATRVLQAHSLQREAQAVDRVSPVSWAYENGVGSQRALQRASADLGRLVAMGLYQAKEPEPSEEIDEKTLPCPMCTL